MIDTVLFDLDGTLVDTAPDMAAALARLCDEENQPSLDYDRVRPHVSDGSEALVKLAFGGQLADSRLATLKQRYLTLYEQALCVHSRLFSGMAELLDRLEAAPLQWGVVTNKPGWLTVPLMQALALDQRSRCIVSSDSTKYRKPHPEPMFHACKLTGSIPENCLYIGDARRDIEAGRNAGMTTMVARYGYIGPDDRPEQWQADAYIDHPLDVLSFLQLP